MGNLIAERRISQMVGERISRLVAILFTKLPNLLIVKREPIFENIKQTSGSVFFFPSFLFFDFKVGEKKNP